MKMAKIICSGCRCEFEREAKRYRYDVKCGVEKFYCSRKCRDASTFSKIKTICKECGIEKLKQRQDVEKYGNGFCSRKCRATYHNKNKLVVNRIKEKGLLKVSCNNCKSYIEVDRRTSKSKYFCDKCREDFKKSNISGITRKTLARKALIYSKCTKCDAEVIGIQQAKKFCDNCRKENSVAIGTKSAAVQKEQRRSKNEILFGEMISKEYPDFKLLFNEPFFAGTKGAMWDADIIIPELKIAIHWNGAWHYKKCAKKHSVAAVQNRDAIKHKTIEDNGYVNYIIKDMGKHDIQKVQEEFELFKQYLICLHSR